MLNAYPIVWQSRASGLWVEARSGRSTDMNASSQFMYIGFNLFASGATVIGWARLIMLEK